MSAEFFVKFDSTEWYRQNQSPLRSHLCALPTFARVENGEYWLRGTEPDTPGRWAFDVRLWLREDCVELDISARPHSVEADLKQLFAWLRSQTSIAVVDDDGEPTGW